MTSHVLAQAQAQAPAPEPIFEVVSVKRNTTNPLGSQVNERPDGGFTMSNIAVNLLISRAYSSAAPIDMVGFPEWTKSERYDVSATSSLSRPTPDERAAMMRAMLANRFHLAVHVENREQSVYELVLARRDGKLGPGIKPVDIDCDARLAAERAAAEEGRNAGTPPPPGSTPRLQGASAAVRRAYSPTGNS